MQILETISAMRAVRQQLRTTNGTLGLVPTMGALHAGHLSLVRAACAACDQVTVSIFVNPTQFGPNEDFERYPRTFEADCALLEEEGVEYLFAPSVAEIYPKGTGTGISQATRVHVGGISERLDGVSRPGHFDGVATVVAKLFNIVEPEQAFFGQKDAAQVAVLRAMVRDLNFHLQLVVCPIVREADGLAMSSRNRYLSATERAQALALSRSLHAIEARAAAGETDTAALLETARGVLSAALAVQVDYLAAVHPLTLEPVAVLASPTLFAVAAYVGTTRLIDNIAL